MAESLRCQRAEALIVHPQRPMPPSLGDVPRRPEAENKRIEMAARFNLLCMALLLLFASSSMARDITYVILWFDTEDYVDPITDDAALRIANDLTTLGVHGTFKVVGEKARVLQQRGRIDVIQALGRDCIAF
jgi:hypothetical protein